MRSEWRDEIAEEWQKPDKRLMVKGYIVGCLIEAGVIDGSDLKIASLIVGDTDIKPKSFASYLGIGKKKPYCEWICSYVNR